MKTEQAGAPPVPPPPAPPAAAASEPEPNPKPQVLNAELQGADKLGFTIGAVHEADAVYLQLALRIPRGRALRSVVDMLLGGTGFERTFRG